MFASERTHNNMKEKQFNLLEEPWIKVLTNDMKEREVSLLELFSHAHEYRQLAGETATQDAAIFRFLLAILATVFYRYEIDGTDSLLSEENDSDPNDVIERWREYREQGHFSEKVFRNYLESCGERFWLFHPETPFYQVADLEYGTDYNTACMMGNIKESNNSATKHHFSLAEGEKIQRLCYSKATRWLIYFNAYAVNVKTDKKAPGTANAVGIGRLGSLGFVMVQRDSLFETLLINLCPLKDGEKLWGSPQPSWEKKVCRSQAREIGIPDNIPEAYSLLSRRICLREQDGTVAGLKVMGGDFYPLDNDVSEQMTMWKCIVDSKTKKKNELPKIHDPEVHIWREFTTLICDDASKETKPRIPGLIKWIYKLIDEGIISSGEIVIINSIGLIYGDAMRYTFGDCVYDNISLSAGLLNDLGAIWRQRISDEVAKCESAADAIRKLCDAIGDILYGKDPNKKMANKNQLVQKFYSMLDKSFRDWLLSIQPMEDDMEKKAYEWECMAWAAGKQVVESYISSLGNAVYRVKKNDKKKSGSIPDIYNMYLIKLATIYPKLE